MSRVVRIVCDCCGKEIPEASSVALQGQLVSFKHYELNAGKPENGIGAKRNLLFGRDGAEGTASQMVDFCQECWETIEPKLQSVFEESIK